MRTVLRLLSAAIALLLLVTAVAVWLNNRQTPPPAPDQLERAREGGIRWLVANRDRILQTHNPMLWRMIQHAAELSGDDRLRGLFRQYRENVLDKDRNSYWHPLFFPGTWVPVRSKDIAHLPDYNQHFIYAITCDRELANLPVVTAQNSPDFCDRHLLRPACATHQLMGLQLMKRSGCESGTNLEQTIAILQGRIRRQLTWDPRLVDVYMQRVLMLIESGDTAGVRPAWLHRLLNAQQPDGGWSPFMPLIPIGGNRYIGIQRFLRIGSPESDFHMTAQGVLLFTLLTRPQDGHQAAEP